MADHYPFTLTPLPYAYDALEPNLQAETIRLHHDILQNNYVKRLNAVLLPYPQYHDWSLKALVAYSDTFPANIKQDVSKYAGGIYNHEIYFDSMTPGGKQPRPEVLQDIINSFGSMDNMKKILKANALSVFGSGYTWLVCNGACQIQIVNTANQETPPLSIVNPLVNIDIWEHSFYLQYKTEREKYIDAWMEIVDWDKVCDLSACRNRIVS